MQATLSVQHGGTCTSDSSSRKRAWNSAHSCASSQRRSSSVRQYASRSTKCDT